MKRCDECAFYEERPETDQRSKQKDWREGWCHRYPPHLTDENEHVVWAADWCGEFKKKGGRS